MGSTTRIRDIKLFVTGRLRIKWIDVEAGANVNFEELDFPVNETIIIHEMNRNDEYSKWLFPGEKTYRFSYRLESMEEDFFVRSRPPQLEESLLTIQVLRR